MCSHLPGQGRFRSAKYRTVGVPCLTDMDYSHAWGMFWESDYTLVNVEHDMECSDRLVSELLACPHPLCTWAYKLYMPSTGGAPHYAQRTGAKPPAGGDWVREGAEWCDFTGIGFCKVTPGPRVRPLAESSWQTVDCAVSKATDGRWHIHWRQDSEGNTVGVEHFHRE